jgi:hypothetical protein
VYGARRRCGGSGGGGDDEAKRAEGKGAKAKWVESKKVSRCWGTVLSFVMADLLA